MLSETLVFLVGLALGLGLMGLLLYLFLRRAGERAPVMLSGTMIAERVRATGKLVGLEVCAKEIATATKGWSWMPPALLSQAKVAMIFHFEKQYSIDLQRINDTDIEQTGPGRYRLVLPPIEGSLRLTDVTPYDIQDGRVLGLLDVIQMNAKAQGELMKQAQVQAGELFEKSDSRYLAEARRCITRQLVTLLDLFDAEVDVVFADQLQTIEHDGGMPKLDTSALAGALARA